MGTAGTLVDSSGNPLRSSKSSAMVSHYRNELMRIKAKYDAAQNAESDEFHWANTDSLSPTAANSPAVRRRLRNRSRYECSENNPYVKGIVLSLAGDFVGTGPKLQITDTWFSEKQRQLIESRWKVWAGEAKIRQKLWRMKLAKLIDGESFALFQHDPRLSTPVKLNMKVIEGDQITSIGINASPSSPQEIDGVKYDKNDNPTAYYVLNNHPGDVSLAMLQGSGLEGEWVDAQFVAHWFRKDRGWLRGVPESTPSLPLCALLRRYTLSVVKAAEIAASFAGVLETEGPPNITAYGDIADMDWDTVQENFFDQFPISHGMITALPFAAKLKQLDAKQPTEAHSEFVDCLLREIARPLLVPFNVASGDSGRYNFASGTLDKQMYWGGQLLERTHCEEEVLEQALALFWFEATRLPGYVPSSPGGNRTRYEIPAHEWGWDNPTEHPDPKKEADALVALWEKGHITDKQIQRIRYNRDPEEHYQDLEDQQKRRKKLGLPLPDQSNNQQPFDAHVKNLVQDVLDDRITDDGTEG